MIGREMASRGGAVIVIAEDAIERRGDLGIAAEDVDVITEGSCKFFRIALVKLPHSLEAVGFRGDDARVELAANQFLMQGSDDALDILIARAIPFLFPAV